MIELSLGDVLLPGMRTIKMGHNKLGAFDISPFPNIRVLYLDSNCLEKISGLFGARHLDSLSVRYQRKNSWSVKHSM